MGKSLTFYNHLQMVILTSLTMALDQSTGASGFQDLFSSVLLDI